MSDDLEEYLNTEEATALVDSNQFQDLYDNMPHSTEDIATLTSCLLEMGINPLKYMDEVVKDMFYELDIKQITIPSCIKVIRDGAFWLCKNLETVTIEDGCKFIERFAFDNCINLRELKLPRTIKRIANKAFVNCKNLKTLYIPDDETNKVYQEIESMYDDKYLLDIGIPVDCELKFYK